MNGLLWLVNVIYIVKSVYVCRYYGIDIYMEQCPTCHV